MLKFISLILLTFVFSSFASDLDMLKKMSTEKAEIIHTHKVNEAKGKKPPFAKDKWTFKFKSTKVDINYNRYLNKSPHFKGRYRSLPTSDYGIGFNCNKLENWYRSGVIRLKINKKDLFAEKPADVIETLAKNAGYITFIWKYGGKGSVRLNLGIPKTGDRVYAKIDINLSNVRSVQLQLRNFPGGFGPAYKRPSHRWVKTASSEAGVPADMKGNYPKLKIEKGQNWVFYADKIQSNGALGLLLIKSKHSSGIIQVTNYPVSTNLYYPPATKNIRLGFYAYTVTNDVAQKMFIQSLSEESKALENFEFLPELKKEQEVK